MKSPKPYLALAACLAAGLTACATTTPQHADTAALTTVHSPGRHAHTGAGCPLGRLLPHGEAIAIDYVDFLQLGREHGHPDTQAWVETLRTLASRTGMKELLLRSLLHGAALGNQGDATAAAIIAVEIEDSR